jgi:hypothetical protein
MKLTIILASIATIMAFVFGYGLARFTYINKADQALVNANSLIMFQRDICYDVLLGKTLK